MLNEQILCYFLFLNQHTREQGLVWAVILTVFNYT